MVKNMETFMMIDILFRIHPSSKKTISKTKVRDREEDLINFWIMKKWYLERIIILVLKYGKKTKNNPSLEQQATRAFDSNDKNYNYYLLLIIIWVFNFFVWIFLFEFLNFWIFILHWKFIFSC